ncbi:Uncharacterised protein [Mycobacteroides abscessus subsp. abscessus]|nr:Uncharacterised protein [Mycobacteroides abscessus subsp. abscessus]
MVLVAPEVVEVPAALGDHRDAVVGVEGREDLSGHAVEEIVAEAGEGRLILLADPVERVISVDVLEPEEVVVEVRGLVVGFCQ